MTCHLFGAKPLPQPIVNWTFRNKFQWNSNKNTNIFSQVNAFYNVVYKKSAILSKLQCVDYFVFWCLGIIIPGIIWSLLSLDGISDPFIRIWESRSPSKITLRKNMKPNSLLLVSIIIWITNWDILEISLLQSHNMSGLLPPQGEFLFKYWNEPLGICDHNAATILCMRPVN